MFDFALWSSVMFGIWFMARRVSSPVTEDAEASIEEKTFGEDSEAEGKGSVGDTPGDLESVVGRASKSFDPVDLDVGRYKLPRAA